MGRNVKDWTPERVEATPLAPHRYTWENAPEELDYRDLIRDKQPKPTARWRDSVAYKEGEAVYVAYGDTYKRARILGVWPEYSEYSGEYRPKFRVQLETAKGLWAKTWYYTHPGFIQRGYLRAGLAPDCEGKL